ncbi:probable pectinesterase/pectinesterase inhibitor 51 [Impatiens glandulifera]|uniref:probable pectinesterase/pectinesterase inhibitor 51 n=1 Tax=Impatiens glandulifera TaxID=253017 RepID=UPI001FB118DA|nr:probable pectinesterase/pectinesterase inhibitor 51 [Impatiens glandulifera]
MTSGKAHWISHNSCTSLLSSFMVASQIRFLLKNPFMASLFLLTPLSFILVFSLLSPPSASTQQHHHDHDHHHRYPFKTPPPIGNLSDTIPPNLAKACKATRFPDLCTSSATSLHLPPSPSPVEIIQSAMQLSSDKLKSAISMVQSILDTSAAQKNLNRSTAAKNCLELLHNSQHRIYLSTDALPRGKIKDVRAWMSAALLFQYDCWNSLKYANDTQQVSDSMAFIDTMEHYTSNALSMVVSYAIFSDRTESWSPPKTERDGFWEPIDGGSSSSGFTGGFPNGLTPDVTVCNGKCDYQTVQDAVDAAPTYGNRRFVIGIKAGIFEETVRVPLEKTNVVFLGDGMGKTVITGSLNVGQPGISTYNTATLGVSGDGFLASGVTIKNTAGPDAHQAVAFRSDSDKSVIQNCEFIGHQDTLYAHGLRQFYKSCRIEGNVDFIFGNSASIFQDCDIQVSPRQLKPEKGETNAVTAHGRTDPAQSTGFVFQNCRVNGTPEYMDLFKSKPQVHKNYLGRPWKEFSRTVFLNCSLEGLVSPQGWLPWTGNFALKTLYYGESNNYGAGAELGQRVGWSSQVEDVHLDYYSVANFIQGNEWIPTS